MRVITHGVAALAVIEKIKPGAKGTLAVELRFTLSGAESKARTNTGGGNDLKAWLMSLQQSGRNVLILVNPQNPKRIFLLELLLNAARTKPSGGIS